jgi:methionyl-tRNA formyltransferase
MRVAFLGTPAAAIPTLAALLDIATVDLVVTRPDRPRGRSRRPAAPEVKAAAKEWGLPVAQPASHDALQEVLAGCAPDLAVVAAYGRIVRPATLAVPRIGFVNVHFSLLPRWRGAAPVERAILAGDDSTGVSLMLMEEGLDTGPVIAAAETDIEPDETGGMLTGRLAHLGAHLLHDALPAFAAGDLHPAPQMETGAVSAPMLSTAEARIEPGLDSEVVHRMVRAFHPRPGAWLSAAGERLGVLETAPSGEVIDVGCIDIVGGVPYLGLHDGSLELRTVQPAGKRALSGRDWANGRRGEGAVLDAAPE